jgi:hypothetical protein
MADAKTSEGKPAPRKRGSWLRVLLWVVMIVVVLLVAVYFIATSSGFFQRHILPRVSESINANVTVSSAEIHPFSYVILHDLKIQPTNQPTLLTAHEARVRYSLMDIIGGNIHVDEMAIVSPMIQIVENPDGSSNLDPLLQKQKNEAKSGKAKSEKASKPLQVDVRKVTISDASISRIKNHPNGTRDLVELTNVDVTLTGLKNGEAGKLELKAMVRDENNPPAPAMYGLLQATVDGSFNFSFTADLKPNTILGDAHLDISQAAGSFSDFAQLKGVLHCDLSPTEIKAVSLNFEKDGVQLGELRASGPFDAQKSEGKLSVELLAVDKKVLNLLGAKSGFDFGSTTITSTNEIELSKAGKAIAAIGELSASKFQLSRTNQSTPAIDLRADYNVLLDQAEQTALLRTLNVNGTQGGRALLRGELTSPMTLAWGNQTNVVGDSAFSLAVTKLNLADWKVFLGELASAGIVDLNLKLLSQQSGKQLTFDATNQIQNLTVAVGGQHLTDVNVMLNAHGQSMDLKQFNLSDYGFQLAKSNHTALAISGSGTYDSESGSADLQVDLKTTLGRLLPLLGQTNMAASAGTAELKAHVTQKQQTQTVSGDLTLTNFSGSVSGNDFTDFATAMTLDLTKTPEQIEIRKAAGTLTENRKAGGSFDISGNYSLTNAPSQLSVKLSNLNENGLRPFLAPMLGGRKLVSVALDGTASAQRSANGDSAIKADLQVTNLVVNDPAHLLAATPLEARVQLDASLVKMIADVRQLQLTLTPTQRAKNQFQLQGRVDMSNTNAMQGNLTLSSDSLDLTSYYDLFAGTNKTAAVKNQKGQSAPVSATAQPAAAAQTAAATNQLPFKNFTVDAKVREFYLREIAATNFQTTVKLDRTRVLLKPFQMTLNNSPLRATADVDLSVPGYKYALTFSATNVPFAPLWNTFEPEEKGQMGGTLTAYVDIGGVGTTGESLQKTLKGTFMIGTTNLNLDVSKMRNPILRDLVAVVAKLPDLFNNPVSGAESLVEGMAGRVLGKFSGGLGEDVSKSPIDVITARGTAGDGRVTVEQAVVRSTVFEATVTNGTVTLDRVLTNSPINFPVSIALNQSIAQRIPSLGSSTTSTNGNASTNSIVSTNSVASSNASYVKIPDFYVEKGTLGKPKPSISAGSLGKSVIQKFIPGLGGAGGGGTNSSGNLLQDIGGVFHRGENANTNQPGTNQPPTNQPATNQSPVNNLLNRFLK